MTRTIRTLLLSSLALGALATAAFAAPTPPPGAPATGGMAGMHASGPASMPTGGADMAEMHAAMMADPAAHESMWDDAEMQAHMAEYGVDVDQMRQWHDEGRLVDEMHDALEEQGIDVAAMHADGPMPTDGAMARMHDSGGDHPGDHHRSTTG